MFAIIINYVRNFIMFAQKGMDELYTQKHKDEFCKRKDELCESKCAQNICNANLKVCKPFCTALEKYFSHHKKKSARNRKIICASQ